MAGGYVICEYRSLRDQQPEFKETMAALREQLIAKAEKDWSPLTYVGRTKAGFSQLGVTPGPGLNVSSGTFGETTIIPAMFANRLGTRLVTWNQMFHGNLGFTIPGSNVIIQGGVLPDTIPEDFKVGVAGLAFLDKAIRISEVKMQIGDKKLPRINIEEAFAYECPAIIFEEGLILDEEQGFEMLGYVLSHGPQRIKLIGFQLNRVYDKLLTNTGTAISAT